MIDTAFVKIWDQTIGAVAWDSQTELASFQYDSKFLLNNWDLAPIKMPIKEGSSIHTFPMLRNSSTFKGLPGLLADVLPDRFGNQMINAWLAQNGRSQNSLNPIEMLCFIGPKGMGALEFVPSRFDEVKRSFDIEMESLVIMTQSILQRKEAFETNRYLDEHNAMLDILKIGTSAGGARPKAIIAYNEKTGQIKSGHTKVPKGFSYWMVKMDGVSDTQFGASQGYGRVEMAYYLMALDCGIEMMESKLIEENERAHFLTKRFDRSGSGEKYHIQTFCAMQHYDFNDINGYSYEQLFQTMRMLRLPYPQAEQMFRRMVFNVLARNCDDHTKNFAFRLQRGMNWELAPAYDLCHAYRPGSEWVSQHALSINGKRKDFEWNDFMQVAESMHIKKAKQIIYDIGEVVSKWPFYANKVNVDARLRDAIEQTLLSTRL